MFHNSSRGLFTLLLMLLEWTRPGLPSPLRPICDLRVLKHFIEEARDAQAAMLTCKEGCGLPEPVTVPQTKVDFSVWERKNALEQAQEVQSGLWLLNKAIGSLRASVTNTALQSHIDNSLINIFRIGKVLRSLNIQVSQVRESKVQGSCGSCYCRQAYDCIGMNGHYLKFTLGPVQMHS
uniref:Erythropoietin n=1 Tax=Hucho hucho TaxID=62062 RepID=A0A4W5K739_9TELE